MDLTNKVAVISGASSGIGKALAQLLTANKAKVVLLARREDKLKEIVAELKEFQHEALAIKTDVTDREQVFNAVKLAFETYGRIDIVVNNAGAGYFGTIEKIPLAEFDRLVKTNVYGMLNLSQAAIPSLKKTQGMIVNVSSALSKRALPFLSAYSSTKSMMDALSDGMRLELRKYGIKILNYCPPETNTEFFETTVSEIGLDHNQAGNRRKADVKDVAARIVEAITAEKREVVEGKSLQVMNFLAPKMLDKMFYKGMVQKILKE
ncbi:MAG: SDR family NAD(P)-dependent oxidoreductase [Chitinophagales bacterium]